MIIFVFPRNILISLIIFRMEKNIPMKATIYILFELVKLFGFIAFNVFVLITNFKYANVCSYPRFHHKTMQWYKGCSKVLSLAQILDLLYTFHLSMRSTKSKKEIGIISKVVACCHNKNVQLCLFFLGEV